MKRPVPELIAQIERLLHELKEALTEQQEVELVRRAAHLDDASPRQYVEPPPRVDRNLGTL